METILAYWFDNIIRTGDLSIHQDLVIVPLYCNQEGGPEYITLKTALSYGLTVSEFSEGGSVPELKMTNLTGKHVLILDGEEVAGAKQNRVLNTTILIAAGASLVIPVSCTEHGRGPTAPSALRIPMYACRPLFEAGKTCLFRCP